jgi:hypothetical protein
MHPRRYAYVTTRATGGVPSFLAEVVQVGAFPTTLNTNQDVVIALRRAESILFIPSPSFRVLLDVLSGTLAVRVQAFGYSALLANRQPASIGKLVGTSLGPPSWS